MKRYLIFFLLSLILPVHFSACSTSGQSVDTDGFGDEAVRILEEVPLIDGHNDVPWQFNSRAGYSFDEIDFMDTAGLEPRMHTDIPRLREGRLGGQFWSVYVPADQPESEAVQETLEQIDFVCRLIGRYPEHLELALTADDVERVFAEGKIASLIGVEGGHSIGNSLAVLRRFYDLGARYMTLTHSRTLDWADASDDVPVHDGLSGFGEEVVREMNRLGMLVDLSHVSPQTMRDAIRVSESPVIFSHSSARGISGHARNVPDDVLDNIRGKGGVVMVTYVPSFVSEELRLYYASENAEQARLESLYRGQPERTEREMDRWRDENPAPEATLKQVADHIDYIRDRIGVDHIGIGADYDGISSLPAGLEDVSSYPDLFAELLRRGYAEEDLKKIAGLNVLRAMREAENVSAGLRVERPPSGAVIGDF
ncbi:MAG: dipeptidase [Balneolaceae bacterium]